MTYGGLSQKNQNPQIKGFCEKNILLFSNWVDFHPALHLQEFFWEDTPRPKILVYFLQFLT